MENEFEQMAESPTLNAVSLWQAVIVGFVSLALSLGSVAVYTGGLVQRVHVLEESKTRVEQKLDSIESKMVDKQDIKDLKEDLKSDIKEIRNKK